MSVAAPSMGMNQGYEAYEQPPLEINAAGRVRDPNATDAERNWSVAMHLAPLAGVVFGPLVIAPLVIWLVRKDESAFNDDHGREVLNFLLSFIVLHVVLALTVIGLIFWPVLWVVGIVNMIRGAVASGAGEFFRYPMTIRFLN